MVSRMGKYFGKSGSGHGKSHFSPLDEFGEYRQKAEDWVRRNPTAAITIAALAGAMLIRSRGLRKLAIPVALIAMRRWVR